jgi:plastocyanin
VPADWDKKQKVVWTLTSRGKTDQAKGWLQPEWELSQDVIIENMGGGVPDPNNKAPAVTVSPGQTVTLPNAATLTATATDDGLPKPYRRTPSTDRDAQPKRPIGVQIKWTQYRGPGKVTFAPDSSPVVHGEPVSLTSKATFSAPGTYVLRVTANDGQMFTSRDVTVTVR